MICTWCGTDYTENSVYHVCDDGTTFVMRREKTQRDFDENRMRRAARRNSDPKNYDEIKWTPYDLRQLKLALIKP